MCVRTGAPTHRRTNDLRFVCYSSNRSIYLQLLRLHAVYLAIWSIMFRLMADEMDSEYIFNERTAHQISISSIGLSLWPPLALTPPPLNTAPLSLALSISLTLSPSLCVWKRFCVCYCLWRWIYHRL